MILNIIHIGKTGGSAIRESIKDLVGKKTPHGKLVLSGHSGRLSTEDKFIFVIRNPVDRYVSAYLSGYREGSPRNHIPWSPQEKKYFRMFPTPNKLAEELFKNSEANEAMKNLRHVNAPLSSFLGSTENIEKCKKNILFVGSTENLDEDFLKICDYIGTSVKLVTNDLMTHKTPKKYDKLKKLTAGAIKNIKKYYKEDYGIIKKIHELNFIDSETYNKLIK